MRTLKCTLLALGAGALIACGGGQKTPLNPTQQVPAAQGHVQTSRTENQNTELEIAVDHLAPPSQVASGATTYVVWTKALGADAKPKNVGSMVIGEDRKGSLKTKTPYESFDVLVTPEASANVEEPTHDPVLKAKVAR